MPTAFDVAGRPWSQGSKAITGATSTALVGADVNRGGVLIYPHASVDVYVNIAGSTAAASVATGNQLLPAGGSEPLQLLGADCPTNAITVYTATDATVYYQTRSALRG